jgi:O-antigen/teichoic acid export membrane protein
VLTMLGPKWVESVPVVHLLAFAMPFMTMQVLFSPACDARGRPGIGVRNGAVGALLLAIAFAGAVSWGPTGLAAAWIIAYPLYLAISAWRSLPVIGARVRDLADAIAPPLLASAAMALIVVIVDDLLPGLAPPLRLAILASTGVVAYAAWLLLFARSAVRELVDLIRLRRAA